MTEFTILNCIPGIMHAVIVIQYMMSFLWCTGSGSSNGLVGLVGFYSIHNGVEAARQEKYMFLPKDLLSLLSKELTSQKLSNT